ncbi:MAG: hypothetical protein B6I37_09105 [Desulfobacteraceae bacterium 4572_35.2]|nr:MAG: hypothetical protein B6I37_09105 [Desulfobacteraceae bacterium 4572_35.2]
MSNELAPSTDEIQREMRLQQKFSMAGAIGRAGSGPMKGGSPVSQQRPLFQRSGQVADPAARQAPD